MAEESNIGTDTANSLVLAALVKKRIGTTPSLHLGSLDLTRVVKTCDLATSVIDPVCFK